MHKVFGEKGPFSYVTRKGAYLIAIRENRIAVVKTSKGRFLLGGGIDPGETDEEAILRECREETGYSAIVRQFVCSAEAYTEHPVLGHFHPVQNYYIGELTVPEQAPIEQDHTLEWVPYEKLRGRFYAPMQNWALEECWRAHVHSCVQ